MLQRCHKTSRSKAGPNANSRHARTPPTGRRSPRGVVCRRSVTRAQLLQSHANPHSPGHPQADAQAYTSQARHSAAAYTSQARHYKCPTRIQNTPSCCCSSRFSGQNPLKISGFGAKTPSKKGFIGQKPPKNFPKQARFFGGFYQLSSGRLFKPPKNPKNSK